MYPTLVLNSSHKMPILGLGTWRSKPNEVGEAVRHALQSVGYTHIDGASIYNNEPEIGQVYAEVFKSAKRAEIFITSKLWNTNHHPDNVAKACRQTLKDLQLDYLDLYLMHWGVAFQPGGELEPMDNNGHLMTESVPIYETWGAMEKLVKDGLVKSIGVANFTTMMLHDLLSSASITPAMNQIELHPYNAQEELVQFCHSHSIAVTAYSPMGTPGTASATKSRLSADPVIQDLARKYNKSTSQILIRFAIERNTVVIPKSVNPLHITENFNVFDFKLEQQDINALKNLDRQLRYVDPSNSWGIPYFR